MKKTVKKNTTQLVYSEEIPFYSISHIPTTGNKTGSWRYLKPSVDIKRSPCEAECPLAIPISDYMFKVQNGELEEAAELVKLENPIPSVCGRVCTHQCEDKCNRAFLDRSVSIHMVERYIGDHANTTISKIDKSNKKIAVVGAGPAGLSTAYYLLILGYKVTIFESSEKLGGILYDIIPVHRGISGRIFEIEILASNQNIVLHDEQTICQTLANERLPSSCFVIERQLDDNGFPIQFIFYGAGSGHGVGFCQAGGIAMALQGKNHYEILMYIL